MRSGIHRFLADLRRDTPEFCVTPGVGLDITPSLATGRDRPKPHWDFALNSSFAIPARVDPFGRYVVPQMHLFLELDHQLERFKLKRSDILMLVLRCWPTDSATTAVIVADLAFNHDVYRTNNWP